MTTLIDSIAKLIEAISHLVGVLVWPSAIVFLAIRFSPAIREFLINISEGTFKGFGLEASAKRAVASVKAAIQQQSNADKSSTDGGDISDRSISRISDIVNVDAVRRAAGRYILWIDDKHDGNKFESDALEELGYKVKKVSSSEVALKFLELGPPIDLIISDLTRPEGPRAGFDLLSKVKEMKIDIPFIIYTGILRSKEREGIRAKAAQLGAFGSTGNAGRLIELVLTATKYSPALN